jgi:hypothetical protein
MVGLVWFCRMLCVVCCVLCCVLRVVCCVLCVVCCVSWPTWLYPANPGLAGGQPAHQYPSVINTISSQLNFGGGLATDEDVVIISNVQFLFEAVCCLLASIGHNYGFEE